MSLEPIEKPPVCQWCNLPKVRLRRLTEKKNEAVWVCADKAGKSKAPCDGPLFAVALKNDSEPGA